MPRRGEVWWVRLDRTVCSEIPKTRPCVVLTSNILNERRRTVVVIPLSTAPQSSPPLLVPVDCGGQPAVAVIDQIRAMTKERFERRIGMLSAEQLASIEDGVREILEL